MISVESRRDAVSLLQQARQRIQHSLPPRYPGGVDGSDPVANDADEARVIIYLALAALQDDGE